MKMKTYEVTYVYTDYEDGEEPEAYYAIVEAENEKDAVGKVLATPIEILDIKEVQ